MSVFCFWDFVLEFIFIEVIVCTGWAWNRSLEIDARFQFFIVLSSSFQHLSDKWLYCKMIFRQVCSAHLTATWWKDASDGWDEVVECVYLILERFCALYWKTQRRPLNLCRAGSGLVLTHVRQWNFMIDSIKDDFAQFSQWALWLSWRLALSNSDKPVGTSSLDFLDQNNHQPPSTWP